jgi:hypothetical protein
MKSTKSVKLMKSVKSVKLTGSLVKFVSGLLLPCFFLLLSCLFLLLPAPRPLAAAAAGDIAAGFGYAAPVTAEKGQEYTSVRLTPEILSKSQSSLADLLLVSEGQPVPYFINSYTVAKSLSVTVYEMALANSYLKDSFQYLDYKLAAVPGDDIAATSVNLASSGQFVKDVALYGSYDGSHWDFLAGDRLFQVEDSRKLSVSLYPEKKYTWYRFRLSGNQEPAAFDRVWLEHSADIVSQNFFVETLTPAMTFRQEGKSTVIALEGLKNLALSEVKLDTESIFKREVSVNGSYHLLYNLAFGQERYRQLTIPLQGYQHLSDRLELQIHNGDDAPIQVDSVRVSYLACELVFQNREAPVTLYFGSEAVTAPPQYDIASYKEHILAAGYGKAAAGEITQLPGQDDAGASPDYTGLFNITIIAAAVLLVLLLVIRLKKVG